MFPQALSSGPYYCFLQLLQRSASWSPFLQMLPPLFIIQRAPRVIFTLIDRITASPLRITEQALRLHWHVEKYCSRISPKSHSISRKARCDFSVSAFLVLSHSLFLPRDFVSSNRSVCFLYAILCQLLLSVASACMIPVHSPVHSSKPWRCGLFHIV